MTITPFVYALGWSLIHSLWQGALLCGIAYVLVSIFYLSSKEKANLLFTLLCLLLVAFIGTYISYLPASAKVYQGGHYMITLNAQAIGTNIDKLPFSPESYFPHISVVYLFGLASQLIALLCGYIRIIQLKRGQKHVVAEEWQHMFGRLLKEFQIKRKVGFFLSEKVQIPTVIGYFKPIILFPFAAVTALDIKQVESILIHEITHIRRHDYALNLIKCLIEAILFFNPFVWFLGRLLEKEREHSCDDQVLKTTGDALVYARALLILESIRADKLPVFALGAFNKKEYLLERIKRMTLMKTTTFHLRHKLAAMTFLIAGIIGLAWTSPSNPPVVDTTLKTAIAEPPLPKAPAQVEISVAPAPAVKVLEPLAPQAPKEPLAPLAPLPKLDTLNKLGAESISRLFSSPEWKALQLEIAANGKEIGEAMAKQFDTPEWKTLQKELSENAAEIAQQSTTELFNSPEWKAAMKDVQEHAQEMGFRAMKHDSAYFESSEWKSKEKEMEAKSKKLEALSKSIEAKMNNPETKAKREALEKKAMELSKRAEVFHKQFESTEFKAKQEAFAKKAEELAKRSEEFRAKADAEFKAKADQKR